MSSSMASIATLQKRVEEMLPSLSKAEAQVLGLLTYGILMLGECGITGLSHGLAKIEQVPAERLRQRLREFSRRGQKPSEARSGEKWMCSTAFQTFCAVCCEAGRGKRNWPCRWMR